MNFAHCLHIALVIGKYTGKYTFSGRIFLLGGGGRRERVTWEDLSMEEENICEGGAGFPSIIQKAIRN